MATHSNILAWRIPWTEELGGYRPWGRRVRHDFENKPQPQRPARVSFLQMPPADFHFVNSVHAHTTWFRIIYGINCILARFLPSLT